MPSGEHVQRSSSERTELDVVSVEKEDDTKSHGTQEIVVAVACNLVQNQEAGQSGTGRRYRYER
jgi:hypothetical protein